MLLVVVVLAVVTVGIVQFGVFFANAQMVAMAARVGGLEASQTANLPAADGDTVPDDVLRAVEHQLASSCIAWCLVRLEHNATPSGDVVVLVSSLDDAFECAPHGPLAAPPHADTQYVRLTVCVPLSDVFPKQLSFFGRQLFGPERTYEHTATFRYELTP
jgi:Flp pilus assembly protein TadG